METTPSQSHQEVSGLPPRYRGPRGEILMELKLRARQTAKELAERLGLSLNAVRHHLKELEAEDLIAYDREQRGVGAPVFAYGLSPAGERLFPRRYEALVTDVLARLADSAGRSAVVGAMEDRYAALTRRLLAELADAPAEERMAMVTRILTDEGYMAELVHSGETLTLREHNCAIQAAAEKFPEICEAEAKFLSQVLVANVERRSHILSGCGVCEYNIRFPGTADTPVPLMHRPRDTGTRPEGPGPRSAA